MKLLWKAIMVRNAREFFNLWLETTAAGATTHRPTLEKHVQIFFAQTLMRMIGAS